MPAEDVYDLGRFVAAQDRVFGTVLEELRSGRKRTHWMWFIFPQFEGLGASPMSQFYSIKSLEEARRYLDHPVLGARLLECTQLVLAVQRRRVSEIFEYPDDRKFHSSMTLFAAAADAQSLFVQALDKYFDGRRDQKTLQLLKGRP